MIRSWPIFREVRGQMADDALLVIPPNFSDEKIGTLYGDIRGFKVYRDTHKALAKSKFAFICSGTATLESALIGDSIHTCIYAKALDLFIGKRLLNINYIGLSNILLQNYNSSLLHRELIQRDVTVDNLLREYREVDRELFREKAQELREYLKYGSCKRVARCALWSLPLLSRLSQPSTYRL